MQHWNKISEKYISKPGQNTKITHTMEATMHNVLTKTTQLNPTQIYLQITQYLTMNT